MKYYKIYIAEFVATFLLVASGCGAIVVDVVTGGAITHAGVALTFGLIVMAMIYSVGDTSGAHLNPAVTIGFWAARRLPGSMVGGYILAQCLGALAAAGVLRVIFGNVADLGATLPNAAVGVGGAFALEVLLTFALMFVILAVATGAKEKGLMAGVAIGATVALDAMWAGPMTGASMNPARSLGPALVSGNLTALWLYIAAPVAGAVIAVYICRLTHHPGECCLPEPGAAESSQAGGCA